MDNYRLIKELLQKVEALTLRVQQLEAVESENEVLREEIARLRKENVELKLENAELKSRLNSNSRNSSRPPSSDGYRKKPAFQKEKKGKQGGQTGHEGNTLRQTDQPDHIVDCKPSQCICGHIFSGDLADVTEKRQLFDIPQPKLDITEFRIHKCTCPVCGLENKGEAPADVNAPVQYGKGVKSLAVLLNVYYKLPVKKIQTLFADLFGYSINESTIQSASEQCYLNLDQTEAIIREKAMRQKVVNVDETGLRVKGSLYWLHTASTNMYTHLFVHKNRGEKALNSDKSILAKFKGWLIHDCWSSYFKFTGAKHALCGAHILRELEGLSESGQCHWAKTFKRYLLKVFETPYEERIENRKTIIAKYNRICRLANKDEPPAVKLLGQRGRYKRTKGRNLLERLISEKEAILAFAFNKEVPFTNNLAERDIRPAKLKLKISNCFRTETGAHIYARIEGFLSTVRKHNRNVFTELYATFEGTNFITR